MGRPKFTPKTAPPLQQSPPHLIHPYQARPHSPPRTASGSSQPFWHNTLSGHTHRWSRQQVRNMSAPLVMLIESDALIIHDVKRRFQAFIIIGLLSVLYGGSSLWPDLRRYIQTVWLNRFRSRIPSTPMLCVSSRLYVHVCVSVSVYWSHW